MVAQETTKLSSHPSIFYFFIDFRGFHFINFPYISLFDNRYRTIKSLHLNSIPLIAITSYQTIIHSHLVGERRHNL